jgi:hypothetical protein
MRKVAWLMLLFFAFSTGCATYCAKKYKVLPCYGKWENVDQQSAQFKKDRRICMRTSMATPGAGVVFHMGGCYPEWVIRAREEMYQDCMEKRGYKYLGLADQMINEPSMD